MPIQPKAVIFDYGMVLSLPQNRADVESMAEIFDVPVPAFETAYWKDRAAFDRADITPEQSWKSVAESLARPLTEAEQERLIEFDNASWSHPNPIMIDWAKALRSAGTRTAILSNMPITLRAHLGRVAAWMPPFDFSCYSCDVRLAKPEPEIFLHCLQGLGADPDEVLFLDDREENISAARAAGIHAIQFSSPEQAQCEIDRHYHLPLPIGRGTGSGKLASQSQSSS